MKIFIRSAVVVTIAGILGGMTANAQTVTVHGFVRSMIGVPIKGATVRLVNINATQQTDSSGYYDFSKLVVGTRSATVTAENSGYSLCSKGKRIVLNLARDENVSLGLFDLSGKLVRTVLDKPLPAGSYSVDLGIREQSGHVLLAKIRVGSAASCYKIGQVQGSFVGLAESASQPMTSPTSAVARTSLANVGDSIVVTHPSYFGGLDQINTRRIPADTGLNNFRMFASDTSATGWYASPMKFVFTPDTVGVSYYQQTVPNYVAVERETQREVEQCLWRFPSEIPGKNKYPLYTVTLNAVSAIEAKPIAWTGPDFLLMCPPAINGRPWWNIVAVQHHEYVHSCQPFYTMKGITGFGESSAECIAALSGFYYWPAGARCMGTINDAYQIAAHYLYFIELKHPGYISSLYKTDTTTDFAAATLKITGDSLSSMCAECVKKGMPYTLGRGAF